MKPWEFDIKIAELIKEQHDTADEQASKWVIVMFEKFRSAETQHMCWKKGRIKNDRGEWVVSNPQCVVTYCDGYEKLSNHQRNRAADLYPVNIDTNEIDWGWTKLDAAYWHKRWEEKGGRPMIASATFVDKPHFD